MKNYKLFLLGLIVIGTLLGSFHHHDDGLTSDDCQVCIVQHNLDVSADVNIYSLEAINTYFWATVPHENSYKTKFTYANTLSRAPPLFS